MKFEGFTLGGFVVTPKMMVMAAEMAAVAGPPALLMIYAATRQPTPKLMSFFPARLGTQKRSPEQIRWIVIHSTEGGTGASNASYFQSPSSGGSTQLITGEDGLYRSVDDLVVPAGAPGANTEGLHIEFVGFAKWPREEWLRRKKTLHQGAKALAEWSHRYKIPLKRLTVEDLKNPKSRGITTHLDVSRAFKKSDHGDPGSGFPMDVLINEARMLA